ADAPGWEIMQPDRFELRFQEFHLQHNDIGEAPAGTCMLQAAAECVVMHFCLQGNCQFATAHAENAEVFKPTEYNMLNMPPQFPFVFSYAPGKAETVSVFLEKRFLLKYIPQNHVLYRKIQEGGADLLHTTNLVINPDLHRVLHDINPCAFSSHMKRLYTQAKIIELLTLQIAQLEEERPAASLKQPVVEKMLVVKEIIEANFNESLSLCQLAREVVTNEQYLKKHFKMVCGCTVYNYILRCRMEKAKELLLDRKSTRLNSSHVKISYAVF